jgi:hypothetical protein
VNDTHLLLQAERALEIGRWRRLVAFVDKPLQ